MCLGRHLGVDAQVQREEGLLNPPWSPPKCLTGWAKVQADLSVGLTWLSRKRRPVAITSGQRNKHRPTRTKALHLFHRCTAHIYVACNLR